MKTTILFFLTILSLVGCSKDSPSAKPPETLPPATTSGANTAGCYINGALLLPKNNNQAIGGPLIYGLWYNLGNSFGDPLFNDYLAISIRNLKDIDGDDIYIHFNQMVQGIGTYTLGQSNGNRFTASPNNNHAIVKRGVKSGNIQTYLSSPTSGSIEITRFDWANNIISGTFSFSLYNVDNPSDKIQISQGRFDINLVTLNK